MGLQRCGAKDTGCAKAMRGFFFFFCRKYRTPGQRVLSKGEFYPREREGIMQGHGAFVSGTIMF